MQNYIGERIKELRKEVGLSQKAFGEKMGVSRDVVKNMEMNLVETKEHFIKLICSTFGVSEKWLRSGEGDIFYSLSEDEELAGLIGKIIAEENDFIKKTLLTLARLDDEEWNFVEKIVRNINDCKDEKGQ